LAKKTPEELFRTGGAVDISARLPDADAELLLGRTLGDYRIKALIGEGGMGRVYRAERADGSFDRDVAIKVSAAGGSNAELRSRFLQEQRILASMEHANVASLIDVGTTEEGWPFIIMELVEGDEIDDYVESRGLSQRQVIELVLPVLEALAFAHARLIVHRDIKPSNIVITKDREPRLLDFGIAKLLEDDAGTMTTARPMTLSSASPEQVLGRPITVASDIYQVGLLLHQLLLGRPASGDQSLADAISRAAAAKPFELDAKARAELPSDLGLILHHCLQIDPAQRYRDVNTLRDDLENYLEHRPVSVSAPTLSYRLGKTIQRNRSLSAVTALLLLTVVGGSTIYAVQINEARTAAENEAAISREITDFLIEVFNVSDPGENLGSTVTARELLEKGAADLENEFHDRPLIRARLQMTIAGVFWGLGLYDDAVPLYESARQLRQRELGPDHPDTLIAGNDLAIMYELQNRFDEAEALYLDVLERQRRVLGSDGVNTMKTLQNLGSLYHKLARYEEAAKFWEEALERRLRVLGPDDREYANTLSNLPIAYIGLGQLDRAQELFIEGLEVKRRVFGPEHPNTITAIANVGMMYVDRARFDEARPYLVEARDLSRRVQGESHPVALSLATSVVSYYLETGKPIAEIDSVAAAKRETERLIRTARGTLGDDHQTTIHAETQLARAENAQGNHEAALRSFRRVFAVQQGKFGPTNQNALATRSNIAATYALQGKFERAADEFEAVVEAQAGTMGERHPDRLNNLLALGDAYLAQGRDERAEASYREAVDGFVETLGPDDPQSLRASAYLLKLSSQSTE